MPTILHIETSTDVCSVALSREGEIVFHREDFEGPNHAVALGVFVDEAMSVAERQGLRLDAVAVSGGPGSYTGLRIGVSMAKGLCYGSAAKLLSVPTLQLLAVPVLLGREIEEDALLCPMLDARRMEVYAAVYDRTLRELRPTEADIITPDSFADLLAERPVYFFGPGAEKCRGTITHPNARFIEGIQPLARNMMPLAEKRLREGQTEDVAYYVPFYLKDFVAKSPKKLL